MAGLGCSVVGLLACFGWVVVKVAALGRLVRGAFSGWGFG